MFERIWRRRVDEELSDVDLHRAALAGSGDAMAALYRRHGGLVYRFVLQMSRDVAVSEEITQEVFLALLTQIDRFDASRGALSTWLCGIARRQLWKHLERNDVPCALDDESAQDLESRHDGPVELLLRSEAVATVRAGMEELPVALREVVILCGIEEMSYEEMSALTGVGVSALKMRVKRACDRLRDRWERIKND